jgi:hypothetical protein
VRSSKEIWFRLRQEIANIGLFLRPPRLDVDASSPLAGLPDPRETARRLEGSRYASELVQIGEQILEGRIPILGLETQTRGGIRWRRDFVSGIETPAVFFRRVPYLDALRAGDHKIIWELNRHQHLVLLAQCWLFTRDRRYVDEIFRQLESWWEQNPYQRGINWTSALEVGFRVLSWIWVFHIAGGEMPPAFRRRFLEELYRHGRHLACNLSVYFSPNTHLLGEAVALHALGRLFPVFPEAVEWRSTGRRIMLYALDVQVRADGGHFEQSTYYHVYALDMFLFHTALEPLPEERLRAMAEYLAAVAGPEGRLPFFGDDDGGRFFHPYGSREEFGRATLATASAILGEDYAGAGDTEVQAAWWIGGDARANEGSKCDALRLFADTGIAVLQAGDMRVVADVGPFGPWGAGHSHSDTLSFIVRKGGEDLLIDPGTYTYVGDPQWRNRFRGSGAHNTVRVDGLDQAVAVNAFSWNGKPSVELLAWDPAACYLHAACSYEGFRHARRMLVTPERIVVVDEIDGPPGEHIVEQFWHPAAPGSVFVSVPAGLDVNTLCGGEFGWRSPAMGCKIEAPVIVVRVRTALPYLMAAVLSTTPVPSPAVEMDGDCVVVCASDEVYRLPPK